jgi:hypothetical protein
VLAGGFSGGPQRHHLGVSGRIMQLHDLVDALPGDLACHHQDRPERPSALVLLIALGEFHRLPEILAVVLIKLSSH